MNPYEPPQAGPERPYAPYGSVPSVSRVDGAVVEVLGQTRPWVLLFAILCFLGSAFMVLGGLMMLASGLIGAGTAASTHGATGSAAALTGTFGVGMGAFYLVMAIVYIYPGIKLWGYGSSIGRLLRSGDTADLVAALGHQKSFWKFSGITTLALIVLYFVAIVGFMLVAVAMKP